ncbi:MAG: hypothetical protein ACJAZ3_002065 [Sphingobacteriales bacterium]
MKIAFIDAENIGLKELEPIEAKVSDKVFVFSKNDAVKVLCERKFFLCMSSYPTGPNQADFYIIGNLVGIIASLTGEQKKVCEFLLYSRDNSLAQAFSFQCKLHKVKFKVPLEPKAPSNVIPITQKDAIEQKIINMLVAPMTAEEIRKDLKAPKPDFTKALNILIKGNKIKRSTSSKKKWVLSANM